VRTLWLPAEGPMFAALMFRSGWSDEQLALLGRSHVVEHLALFRIGLDGGVGLGFNGFVDAVRTVFHCIGSPDDVVRYLSGVTSALRELPTARLPQELPLLRSEAAERSGAVSPAATSLLRWRYGPQTFGLAAYEELGLRHLDYEQVQAWADDRFTRDNAVLLLSGPPPEGLRVDLPPGRPYPIVEPSSALHGTPAWYQDMDGGAALSALVPRRAGSDMLQTVLHRRLMERLRYDRGASYSPSVDLDRRDVSTLTLTAVVSAVEGHQSVVAEEVLGALAAIAQDGCTERDTSDVHARLEASVQHPDWRRGWLERCAWDVLVGAEPISYEQWWDEARSAGAAEVAAAAEAASATALYMLPGSSPPPGDGLAPAPTWSETAATGQRYVEKQRSSRGTPLVVTVGTETVSVSPGAGRVVTVAYDDCQAMLASPGGRRALIGGDGFVVEIEPARFRDGQELVGLLDARVPPDRVVPAPPGPELPPDAFDEPVRAWVGLGLTVALTVVGLILVATSYVLGLVLVASGATRAVATARGIVRVRRARLLPPLLFHRRQRRAS